MKMTRLYDIYEYQTPGKEAVYVDTTRGFTDNVPSLIVRLCMWIQNHRKSLFYRIEFNDSLYGFRIVGSDGTVLEVR